LARPTSGTLYCFRCCPRRLGLGEDVDASIMNISLPLDIRGPPQFPVAKRIDKTVSRTFVLWAPFVLRPWRRVNCDRGTRYRSEFRVTSAGLRSWRPRPCLMLSRTAVTASKQDFLVFLHDGCEMMPNFEANFSFVRRCRLRDHEKKALNADASANYSHLLPKALAVHPFLGSYPTLAIVDPSSSFVS